MTCGAMGCGVGLLVLWPCRQVVGGEQVVQGNPSADGQSGHAGHDHLDV